jgi:hypothetical protein
MLHVRQGGRLFQPTRNFGDEEGKGDGDDGHQTLRFREAGLHGGRQGDETGSITRKGVKEGNKFTS